MHKNFYLFKAQIAEIAGQIKDQPVLRCFTVHKNELIFELQDWHLAVDISPEFPGLFLLEPRNYKSPAKDIFKWDKPEQLLSIEIAPFDKLVTIKGKTHTWIVRFYGGQPNIFFMDDETLIDVFKHYDEIKQQNARHYKSWPFSVSVLQKWIDESPQISVYNAITRQIPACNGRMKEEILFRAGCGADDLLRDQPLRVFLDHMENFYRELRQTRLYLYRENKRPRFLTLYRSEIHRSNGLEEEIWDSVNKGWTLFVDQKKRSQQEEKLYSQCITAIERKENALIQAIAALEKAADIEKKKDEAEHKGNLLLTLMPQVPKGADTVELPDVISGSNKPVTISLDPKKSAAENATYYFNKYKNTAEKKEAVQMKKSFYDRELQQIRALKRKTEKAGVKQLRQVREELIAMRLLQDAADSKKQQTALAFSFKRALINEKWEVYIGKNNFNNDQLTFDFANKWDIWLHARNVPGSHVILRKPDKNSDVPAGVIEKTARIAAAHSRAKNDSTVAVMYTEARHVSRIRKAEPGKVSVKNEKVIFVEPFDAL